MRQSKVDYLLALPISPCRLKILSNVDSVPNRPPDHVEIRCDFSEVTRTGSCVGRDCNACASAADNELNPTLCSNEASRSASRMSIPCSERFPFVQNCHSESAIVVGDISVLILCC